MSLPELSEEQRSALANAIVHPDIVHQNTFTMFYPIAKEMYRHITDAMEGRKTFNATTQQWERHSEEASPMTMEVTDGQ